MGLRKSEILEATAMEDWQQLRADMKGKPTKDKLRMCHDWLLNQHTVSSRAEKEVQVLNYLNALSRGGQIAPVEQVRGSHLLQLFSKKRVEIYRDR